MDIHWRKLTLHPSPSRSRVTGRRPEDHPSATLHGALQHYSAQLRMSHRQLHCRARSNGATEEDDTWGEKSVSALETRCFLLRGRYKGKSGQKKTYILHHFDAPQHGNFRMLHAKKWLGELGRTFGRFHDGFRSPSSLNWQVTSDTFRAHPSGNPFKGPDMKGIPNFLDSRMRHPILEILSSEIAPPIAMLDQYSPILLGLVD